MFSLLDVFEHNAGTMYADVIHLRQSRDGTSEGYGLMSERMATVLARTWNLRSRRRGEMHQ